MDETILTSDKLTSRQERHLKFLHKVLAHQEGEGVEELRMFAGMFTDVGILQTKDRMSDVVQSSREEGGLERSERERHRE